MSIESRIQEGIGVIKVTGELTRDSQSSLTKVAYDLVSQEIQGLILDFTSLEYIDSAGLGACAGLHKKLRADNRGGLCVFGASPSIFRMWQIIRLDLVIPVYEDESAAFAHYKDKEKSIEEEPQT